MREQIDWPSGGPPDDDEGEVRTYPGWVYLIVVALVVMMLYGLF